MKGKVTLEVGGTLFTTTKDSLENIPGTRLSVLDEKDESYDPISGHYFFDRNPELFNWVLDSYRCGFHFFFACEDCFCSVCTSCWNRFAWQVPVPACASWSCKHTHTRARALPMIIHTEVWLPCTPADSHSHPLFPKSSLHRRIGECPTTRSATSGTQSLSTKRKENKPVT